MSRLVEFITQMAVDPVRQVQFAADPKACLADASLSPADKAALLSGNREDVTAAAAQALPPAHLAAVMGNCFVADPGPDPDTDPDPWPDIAAVD